MKRLKILVNHSKDHLQENLEKFINYPLRVIERIDFHPVASAAGGLIHTAYVIYAQEEPEEKPCEHCGSAGRGDIRICGPIHSPSG